MATTAFPLDALSGAPTYYAQSIRQAFSAFLGVAPAGRPLGATSGVRPGTPSTTVTVSGFTWACAAHSGVLDVQAAAVAGPYLYATDGNDTSSISAADATNPRVDIVFVQINDTVQDGSGAESASVGYLAGTPASSPVAPAAPARSLVLAQISVPKAGGGNPTVSWVAPVWDQWQGWSATATITQSIPSLTDTHVRYDSVLINQRGGFSSVSDTVTIVIPGWYTVSATVTLDQDASNNGYLAITVNGNRVAVTSSGTLGASTNAMRVMTVTAPLYLNAGDVIDTRVWHNAGTAININPANGPVSFSGVRVGT